MSVLGSRACGTLAPRWAPFQGGSQTLPIRENLCSKTEICGLALVEWHGLDLNTEGTLRA